MSLKIKRFEFGKDEQEWNGFLSKAKNQTFLFNRDFMDYHKNRFKDYSLMVYNDKGNLIACFPANQKDDKTIVSHSGLTYGGFILEKELKLIVILSVYIEVLKYYHNLGLESLVLKSFPKIYNNIPSDEIEYALFLSNANLIRRDTSIVINQKNKFNISGNIRRESKKAQLEGYKISESYDFSGFWNNVLVPNLKMRFGISPVHSANEIDMLAKKFPDKIKLYIVKSKENKIVAGTVFFLTENVSHCQYIASTDIGRKSGALNFLFVELINNILIEKSFFDFGIVNENDGLYINQGMLGWKERMGGRVISNDFFLISTKNYISVEKAIK